MLKKRRGTIPLAADPTSLRKPRDLRQYRLAYGASGNHVERAVFRRRALRKPRRALVKKSRSSLAGAASALALMGAITVGLETNAQATVITSQLGIPEADGSTVLGETLTGGFIKSDWSWSHKGYGVFPNRPNYVIMETIVSATLRIDLIDAELAPNKRLDLYAGTDASGTFIGSAYGQHDGWPGPWRGLPPGGTSSDNLIVISSDLYADIADGRFDIFGANEGMILWGSNRVLLTITTADLGLSSLPANFNFKEVPETGTLTLFGLGLAGLGYIRRRKTIT